MGTVGIIANPAAGKDIRRLVSAASPTSDMAKIGIVQRALVGAIEGGAERILIADDHKSLGRRALERVEDVAVPVEIVGEDPIPDSSHTQRMAALLRERGVGAVVSLGGDGTHRDIVKGWPDVPLVPVSTGTNNVFPRMLEATIAGQAAAAAASLSTPLSLIAQRAKVLRLSGEGDDSDDHPIEDLALVDIALVAGGFTASRAVWDPATLQHLVVTTAELDTIGLSSIAARLAPVSRKEFGGVHIVLGDGPGSRTVRAPIAPGLYLDVQVASAERLPLGRAVVLAGPGVLAFDGERDLVLRDGQSVEVTVESNGPWVIDPAKALVS